MRRFPVVRLVVPLLVTLVTAVPASAQHVDALVPGDKIRFEQLDDPRGPRITGHVVSRTPDSLRVALVRDGSEATFAVRRITRVELASQLVTRRAAIGRGALGGAIAGAVAFFAGSIAGDCLGLSTSADPNCRPDGGTVAWSVLAGAAIGTAGGALWGAVRPIESWVPLVEARRAAILVAPGRGVMHVGVVLR